MRMRTIAIGQNRNAELAIAITEQESRVTGNTPAVCDVAIALAHLRPPRQPEPGGFVAPNAFYPSFELVVLSSKHLLHGLLADDPFVFEDSAVEISDQPVGLIQHRAIDDP